MLLSLMPAALAVDSSSLWEAEQDVLPVQTADAEIQEPFESEEEITDEFVDEELDDEFFGKLMLESGIRPLSMRDGTVELKPTREVRWIDRVNLPDYALALYETLEEAVDGDGYNDYLIDDRYYDLEGEDIRTDVPGKVMRGTLTSSSDGSSTRYTAIVVTTTQTAATDQNTKDYIRNCISAVFSAFKFDHQEVFWLNGLDTVRFERNDGKTYYGFKLCSRRTYPDGRTTFFDIRRAEFRPGGKWDIRRAIARRDADVEKILGAIPAGADRFTQIYYINDWLSEYNSFNSLVSSGESNPWYAFECISALEGGTGIEGPVCSGYSAAFKVLCDALGIPCVTVRGLGNSGGAHRWNYAQMEDGKWYAVDINYNSDLGKQNRTRHLLVGGNTLTVDSKEFRLSHVEQNGAYYGGVENFINGPVLNDTAYIYAPEDDGKPHGKVSVSEEYAPSGTRIKVTLTSDSGYKAGPLTVVAADGRNIPVTGSGNSYAFFMPAADVTLYVDFIKTA